MIVFPDKTPKARKEHICHLCEQPIVVGEEYVRWAYVDGGVFNESKAHTACASVISDYMDGESEYDVSSVLDWVEEICEKNSLCLYETPTKEKVELLDKFLRARRKE